MNLTQLRAGVYARAGAQTNDPVLTTQVVNQYVNDAMHMAEAEQDWPWLATRTTFSTEAGTDLYGTPADWMRTRSLRIADDSTMTALDVDELEDRWGDRDTGRPCNWAEDAGMLRLRPIPDGVYVVTHRYVRAEPDLTSDGQSPLMPAKFHAAIVEAATVLALRGDREDSRAVAASNAYTVWLAKMRDDSRRSTKPTRVRSRPDGWL